MFFFSNKLDCPGSIDVSVVASLILVAVLRVSRSAVGSRQFHST
jgi:hypothetical protein